MTERQVAWLVQEYAHLHGADDLSFEPIIAGGAHGSLPHWRASDAPLPSAPGVTASALRCSPGTFRGSAPAC